MALQCGTSEYMQPELAPEPWAPAEAPRRTFNSMHKEDYAQEGRASSREITVTFSVMNRQINEIVVKRDAFYNATDRSEPTKNGDERWQARTQRHGHIPHVGTWAGGVNHIVHSRGLKKLRLSISV